MNKQLITRFNKIKEDNNLDRTFSQTILKFNSQCRKIASHNFNNPHILITRKIIKAKVTYMEISNNLRINNHFIKEANSSKVKVSTYPKINNLMEISSPINLPENDSKINLFVLNEKIYFTL